MSDDTRAAAMRVTGHPDAVYAGPVQPDGSFRVWEFEDEAKKVAAAWLRG